MYIIIIQTLLFSILFRQYKNCSAQNNFFNLTESQI